MPEKMWKIKKIRKTIMWIIIITVVSTIFTISYRFYLSKSFAYNDEILHSKNYNNGKFVNSIPNPNFSFNNFGKMVLKYIKGGQRDRKPSKTLPVIEIGSEFSDIASKNLRFAWLGHSSIMIEYENKRFLFDPVFSERASIVQWLTQKDSTCAVKFKLCRLRKTCIHRRDAMDAEINDFLFAVERTAKRNHSI